VLLKQLHSNDYYSGFLKLLYFEFFNILLLTLFIVFKTLVNLILENDSIQQLEDVSNVLFEYSSLIESYNNTHNGSTHAVETTDQQNNVQKY